MSSKQLCYHEFDCFIPTHAINKVQMLGFVRKNLHMYVSIQCSMNIDNWFFENEIFNRIVFSYCQIHCQVHFFCTIILNGNRDNFNLEISNT